MTNLVHVNNLGNDFDIGVIEANKIHVKVDGTTIVRDPATGVVGVNPSALVDKHLQGVAYTPDPSNPANNIPLNFNMSDGVQHTVQLASIQDAFGVLLGYMVSA